MAIQAARAGHRSGKIAVVVSGLLLLVTIGFLTWGIWWIGLLVAAVVAVLVFAWARSRSKPPPGPDDAQREEGTPGLLHRQAHLNGLRRLLSRPRCRPGRLVALPVDPTTMSSAARNRLRHLPDLAILLNYPEPAVVSRSWRR